MSLSLNDLRTFLAPIVSRAINERFLNFPEAKPVRTVLRGYVGELVFFFVDGHAIGLDLYRDWIALGNAPLIPGEERVVGSILP